MSVKLKDGTEISFDYYAISYKEANEFLSNKEKTNADVFAMMSRVTGIEVAKFESLPWPDWRKVAKAFWEGMYDPNAGDSLVSASTGESNTEQGRQS